MGFIGELVPGLRLRPISQKRHLGGADAFSPPFLREFHSFNGFQVLASITANSQAATSLVLRSSLLSWIEIQLISGSSNTTEVEAPTWLRVMDNILRVVDGEKVETATRGVWRDMIGRCLLVLVKRGGWFESHYFAN